MRPVDERQLFHFSRNRTQRLYESRALCNEVRKVAGAVRDEKGWRDAA